MVVSPLASLPAQGAGPGCR